MVSVEMIPAHISFVIVISITITTIMVFTIMITTIIITTTMIVTIMITTIMIITIMITTTMVTTTMVTTIVITTIITIIIIILRRSVKKKRIFYGQADCKGGASATSALTVSKCENFDLLSLKFDSLTQKKTLFISL